MAVKMQKSKSTPESPEEDHRPITLDEFKTTFGNMLRASQEENCRKKREKAEKANKKSGGK